MNDKFIRSLKIDWNKTDPDSWLQNIPALRQIHTLEFRKNITIFAGENGTGKSTLLEAIATAYGFNPEGGTLNYRFSTFDDVSELNQSILLMKGFRRASFGCFSVRKVFLMWQPKRKITGVSLQKKFIMPGMAENPFTNSPMARVSWHISSLFRKQDST